jgi:hypothetical protein
VRRGKTYGAALMIFGLPEIHGKLLRGLPASHWKRRLMWLCMVVVIGLSLAILPYPLLMLHAYFFGENYNTYAHTIESSFVKVDEVLFHHKICKFKDTCTVNGPIYVYRGYDGFEVKVYGITDMAILNELSQTFLQEISKDQKTKSFDFFAYGYQSTELGVFDKLTSVPLLHIKLRRTK